MSNAMPIGGKVIGAGHPCFLIAEVAQAHDGSLGMAHSFIDAAADAGADAIKFQTHIAEAESTLDEPFRIKFSRQDATRYAYWRRMEFTREQWQGLMDHAKERNILFLSSPFSVAAVEMLAAMGMQAWKIGSGEVRSRALMDAIVDRGGLMLVSTGMSSWGDIDDTVKFLGARGCSYLLMQCTSQYPTPLKAVGLNVLEELRRRYGCLVGLSDHSGSPFPAIAALSRGASVVEVHVTFDRRMFGPDTVASVTFDEFRQISAARDAIAEMDAFPVDKDAVAESLRSMRTTFGKSIALVKPLSAGTVLTPELLTFKKPASGIRPEELDKLIGRRLVRDVMPDRLLRWEDVDVEA